MAITKTIGLAQLHVIMATPERNTNFPSGGLATIGEGGPEMILVDGKMELVRSKPVINYL
jgi:hypothetical protein